MTVKSTGGLNGWGGAVVAPWRIGEESGVVGEKGGRRRERDGEGRRKKRDVPDVEGIGRGEEERASKQGRAGETKDRMVW